MEQPFAGRSTIQDNITNIQITIPAKKNWFVIIFICFWLCGWCFGEITVLVLIVTKMFSPAELFLVFWVCLWTVGGLFAFRALCWMLVGKEIITVGQGTLTVARKGQLFDKPKVYDLNEIKAIRIQDDGYYNNSGLNMPFNNRRFRGLNQGVIRFDYGMGTIRFANGIDEAEATYILQQLKDRHFLTDRNYN